MKKIICSLAIGLMSYSANSQLNYVDIDWVIDQTQVMPNDEVDTLEIDINQDGVIDLIISSWSNHTFGISTAIEVLLSGSSTYGLQTTSNCNYLQNCIGTPSYNDVSGYIYTSNCSSDPYANQYVKFPFQFQGATEGHCGFLYVRYVGTTITIEGYAWNPVSGGNCSCSSSGWLSIEELSPDELQTEYQYYNLLGQRVNDPKGLALKVYESGVSEKVFISGK